MRLADDGLATADQAGERRQPAEARSTPLRDRSVWLAQHVLPHEPALRAWLRQCNVGAHEANDIIYETYAAFDGAEAPGSPAARAFQTAQSVMRRLEPAGARWTGVAKASSVPAMASPSPQEEVRVGQALPGMRALIGDLPADCREVFRLRTIDGLSQRDIAARMSISESSVEKHIARALRFVMSAITHVEAPDEVRPAARSARS